MRVKRGNVLRNRHKKILKLAKGFQGARSRIFKVANTAVMKALKYQYRARRNKKRFMRRLWISRINAAARMNSLNYSRLTSGLKKRDSKKYSGIFRRSPISAVSSVWNFSIISLLPIISNTASTNVRKEMLPTAPSSR